MIDFLFIFGSAIVANIVWTRLENWLDTRPRKAVFVIPKISNEETELCKQQNI